MAALTEELCLRTGRIIPLMRKLRSINKKMQDLLTDLRRAEKFPRRYDPDDVEVMREELAIHGTRVVCISPGRCATDLRRKLAPDEDPSTIMQPEDVAAVIEMLTSDLGRLVDSQNLVVRT